MAQQSRRQFLISAAGATAAIAIGGRFAQGDEVDPQIAKLVANTIGVDMHNHIDVPQTADAPRPNIDLVGEMKKSGLSAICMTFAVDYQPLTAPGQAHERFQNALTAMDADLIANGMQRAYTLHDLQTAHDQGKPTVIQAVEGGHFLEGKIERLEAAYKRGLRVLGLLHDHDADPPLGDIYTAPAHLDGLTDLGAEVIKACDHLGIVIDLTHASANTVAAALKIATKPVLFSHTGLDTQLGNNRFMAQMMKQRLLSKDHAKAIADAGGVVGVWTHLANTVVEYVHNIRAMVDVCGIDHVGIGTDTKMTPAYSGGGPRGGPGRNGPTTRAGGPPGGGPGRAGSDRTNQCWPDINGGFYFSVVGEMLKQGFTPAEIGKIGGGNFCRVFDAATAGRA